MKKAIYCFTFCLLCLTAVIACKQKQKVLAKEKQNATKKTKAPTHSVTAKKTDATEVKDILGVSSKEMRSNKLYVFIEDWYGVPYKYGGCKKTGVDCSCFTSILYESVYQLHIGSTAADIYKSCDKLTLENAREGDFVFFKISGTTVSHIGVLLKHNNFVHASTSKGVIINNLNEAYYKKYFHSAGRLKNS